jgi:LmbE family N-acetylglucosaminyl deacetylase
MNILAIGSHPDDIEYMCAGTLLKYKKAGHLIFIALTTSGNIGSNQHSSREEIAAIREKEQLEAAKYYAAEVRFLRFDDEGLQDTPQTRKAVIEAVRWANPEVILTNPPWDGSTDHAMTGRIVSQVLLSLPGKLIPADVPPIQKAPSLFFWDTGGGIDFNPEILVDISEFMETKLEALHKHESQYAWMKTFMEDDLYEACRVLARFRGVQRGCKYAEGFVGHKVLGYFADYRLLP